MSVEERLTAVEQALARLADAQAATETAIARLVAAQERTEHELRDHRIETEQRFAHVDERFAKIDERFAQVEDQLLALTEQVASLTSVVAILSDRTAMLVGHDWERRYRENAPSFFGSIVRRVRVLHDDRLALLLEAAVASGALTEDEADEVEHADIVLRGRRKDDGAEVYVVAEISAAVAEYDVERAARRASLLAKTGVPSIAVVAGQVIRTDAADLARRLDVWHLSDGRPAAPPGA